MHYQIFLTGLNKFEAKWIGWAGVNVPDEVGQKSLTEALAEKVCGIKISLYRFSSLLDGHVYSMLFTTTPLQL